MPAVAGVSLTSDPYVNGLLSSTKWAVQNLTYSFPGSGSFYGSSYSQLNEPTNGFVPLNPQQQAVVQAVLANYAAIANLTFSQLTESSSLHADLRFAMTGATQTAHAYFPSPAAAGGDTWLRNNGTYSSPVVGNYAYTTFLHEIGHALGLDHGHEGMAAVPIERDSMEYTVMSYRSYEYASTSSGYTNETWGYAQSLMMYDIAAIQYLYGANFNSNAGATTYSWSPTTGQMFINGVGQAAPGGNQIFLTIWDGGGTDTYDFSSYSSNLNVSLAPGAWTTTSQAQLALLHYNGSKIADGNIANALLYQGNLNSLIENAVGGSGHDSIAGNQIANALLGQGGNDTIYGDAGNDWLQGGAGNDLLIGGSGSDSFVFISPGDGQDVIQDFTPGQDIITLSASGFGLGSTGSLAAAGVSIVYGSSPVTAGKTILVQQDKFYWDSDGTGPGAAIQLGQAIGANANSFAYNLGPDVEATAIGDFDGNGSDDFFLLNPTNQAVATWLLQGGSLIQSNALGTLPAGWDFKVIGDFNGDGRDDIMFQHGPSGAAGAWLMQNGQPTGWLTLGTIGSQWRFEGAGDLNGDGTDDVLFRDTNTGYTGAWVMNNGIPTGWIGFGIVGASWNVEAVGDLNGDSFDDVVFRNTTNGYTGAWLMGPSGPANWASFGNVANEWTFEGIGAINTDPNEDIILHNTVTGSNGAWIIANSQVAGWSTLGSGPASWTPAGLGDLNGNGEVELLLFDLLNNTIQTPGGLTADDFLIV